MERKYSEQVHLEGKEVILAFGAQCSRTQQQQQNEKKKKFALCVALRHRFALLHETIHHKP